MATAVELQEIVKSYGGERALDGVSLELVSGEVHALLGPNGSGKSTLIGCLGGAVTPDSGQLTVCGVSNQQLTPQAARDMGIAVIYQHFSLAESLTVTENVFLGRELKWGPFINRRRQRQAVREVVAQFGLQIDPDAVVEDLSQGDRQLVEIAKALVSNPTVLILDEPTTALSMPETKVLLSRIRSLAAAGLAIVFTSHLLDDVLAVADTVTVLRDGRVYERGPIGEFDHDRLVDAIAPRGMQAAAFVPPRESVCVLFKDALVGGVGPIDLEVHDGEVVAVFGILGAGRTELLEGLVGINSASPRGVQVQGTDFTPRTPRHALSRRVALVPADRTVQGLFAGLPALENVLIPHVSAAARFRMLRRKGFDRGVFDRAAVGLALSPARSDLLGSGFSGGNQQKLLLGRWLNELSDVEVLLLDEPTQGVDVGARSEIYSLIRGFAARPGCCVIIAASDIEEVAAVADRVLVLAHKRPAGEVLRGPDMERELMRLAHQSATEQAA